MTKREEGKVYYADPPVVRKMIKDEYNIFDKDELVAGHLLQEIVGKSNEEACLSYVVNILNSQPPETALMINGKVAHKIKGKYLKCFKDKTLEDITKEMIANKLDFL